MMVDEMSLGLAPVIVDQLLETSGAIRAEGVTVLLVEQDVHRGAVASPTAAT